MNRTAAVKTIRLYPIKSLDGVPVSEAYVLPSGALKHDREFALFDKDDKWINGKRDSRIHQICAEYDIAAALVSLRKRRSSHVRTFHLLENRRELERWFEDFFGFGVSLRRNSETGFPDDLKSPGPTIVSSATLEQVSTWFALSDVNEARRRFRANIEVATEEPFWEDGLFTTADTTLQFRIGNVTVLGVNPCERCAVPSRDTSTGLADPDFQRKFAANREATLPPWVVKTRFNHYYRLAVNTRIPPSEAGKALRPGDIVSL